MQNPDQKVNPRQTTICLEQNVFASQENFTSALLVMSETFGRVLHSAALGKREQTGRVSSDLLDVQHFTPAGCLENKYYANKCVHCVKIGIATK